MKKIIAIIILIIIIGVFAVWFMKAPIMSSYLSKKLKIPISIGNIEVSKSHMKIKDFKIKNPGGYKQNTAFYCKEIVVSYTWSELKKDPSIIDKIIMNDNYLNIDCKNALCSSNNWTDIISLVSQKEEKKKQQREVIVNSLVMNNLDVDILGLGLILGAKKHVNIPSIEFSKVSSKEGFPTQQLIAAIFKQAGLFDYIKEIIKRSRIFDGYFSPFKLFGQNEEDPQEEISSE